MKLMPRKMMMYARLMRLDRPIGILLLLWPTLSALWIAAKGLPDLNVLIVFILGVIVMRSAGCVINDYVDRDIDCLVARTANRPLASGSLQAKHALIACTCLTFSAFALVLLLNKITILMSLVALFLVVTYPFIKRYSYLPQIYLGITFSWAIPMAFAAQAQSLPPLAWLLFLANILWVTVYDTYYAMADSEDDVLVDVKSTAILFGYGDRFIIGILQACFLLLMIVIGAQSEMGFVYYFGVAIACMLFIHQQIITEERLPEKCLLAFLNNKWVGAVLFASIAIHFKFT